jgi:DNA-binding NarL/FixJ family response regulator
VVVPVIRLLIVDDHGVVRDGLRMLFAGVPEVEVVGTAADGAQAVTEADRTAPDVVLMDVGLPELDGVEATRRITAAHPASRVIMLTAYGDQGRIKAAYGAGAAGYLLKDNGVEEVVRAVRAVDPGVR